MQYKTVGIIGYGEFGAFIALLLKRFTPHIHVRIYSRRNPPDGEKFFSLEETCQSDAIVLSVPIATFEETLKKILPLVPETSVLVDVSTVKMHTVTVMEKLASGRRYIATHPMFGPESYAKRSGDISGFRIVLTEHTLSVEEYQALIEPLRKIGFTVIETTPEKHDKHLAETLFLTHFIGQIIKHTGFSRTEIDTVSFGFLIDAVDSVRNDTALFKDVYTFNPFCKGVLDSFEHSEKEVRDLLDKPV